MNIQSIPFRQRFLNRNYDLGVADLLNWSFMAAPDIMVNIDDSLIRVYAYRGPDYDSLSESALNYGSESIQRMLKLSDQRMMIETNLCRVKSSEYVRGRFPDVVSSLIDLERERQYKTEGEHFDTVKYIIFTQLPPRKLHENLNKIFIKNPENILEREDLLYERIKSFRDECDKLMGVFSQYMTVQLVKGGSLLTFFHYCLSGETYKLKVPSCTSYMGEFLANEAFISGSKPMIGEKYISSISFLDFPEEMYPDSLEILSNYPAEYRWNFRYISLDYINAEKYIKKYKRYWNQKKYGIVGMSKLALGIPAAIADKDAQEMEEECRKAIKYNSNGKRRYAFVSNTVILLDKDKALLSEKVRGLADKLRRSGFNITIETTNSTEAFLGSLPGHGCYNAKRPFVDSVLASRLIPNAGIYQGQKIIKSQYYLKNSQCLFRAKTKGQTPYYFNNFVGDVGHSLIIGPTGAGKTTLMALMMFQHMKYPDAKIFMFDKDFSNKYVIKALGGTYYEIGKKSSLKFAPLQYINDPHYFDWACSYLEDLLVLQGIIIDGSARNKIREALKTLLATDPKFWTIGHFATHLPDTALKNGIQFYANSATIGKLLNNPVDNIDMTNVLGIEIGWLLNTGKVELYLPVINYLFKKFEESFKTQVPTQFYIEEAWLSLGNKYVSLKLADWLLTLRKMNVALFLTLQEVNKVLQSIISSTIIESCLTKIFLPNQELDSEYIRKIYREFGLSNRQLDLIEGAEAKKEYYVKSSKGSRMIDLDLRELSLAFMTVTTKEDKKYFDEIYVKDDDQWVYKWLKYKKLDHWLKDTEAIINEKSF